jgi:hypothetical protein
MYRIQCTMTLITTPSEAKTLLIFTNAKLWFDSCLHFEVCSTSEYTEMNVLD